MSDEMLRTIGYTGNMRTASNLLDVAIMKLGGAIKLTTSAIFPYVAILGGIVAILSKVKSAHAESAIAAENAAKKLHEQATGYESTTGKIDAYGKSIGALPQYLRDLEKALNDANAATTAQMKVTNLATLASTSKQLADLKMRYAELTPEIKKAEETVRKEDPYGGEAASEARRELALLRDEYSAIGAKLPGLNAQMKQLTSDVIAQGKGFADNAAYMAASGKAADELTVKQKKLAEDDLKNKEKQEDAAKKLADENYRAMQKILADNDKVYAKDYSRFINGVHKKDAALRSANGLEASLLMGKEVANEETYRRINDAALNCYNQMMSGMGQAAAKMIVEGEDFGIAMQNVFKSMLESFIAAIIEMTARWLAFQALTGMFGSSSGIVSFISGGKHATGVDTLVDRPRLLQVGENGPERVTVTPITGASGSMAAAGAGGGMNITIPITINSTANASQLANEVGRKIISQIRGLGQNNFVRGK
jgi:hypothetical protein